MLTTRFVLLTCALLLAGCAGSDPAPEPAAPAPVRLSDPAAETARLKKAQDAGELEPTALEHAAYLGDAPARAALGLPAEVEIKKLGAQIAALGGLSTFRTALAGQAYAAPDTDWSQVKAALARWIQAPEEEPLREATAAAVAKLRDQVAAKVERQSALSEEVAEDGTPVVVVPSMTEEDARELIRLTSQIESLRFLEQCAAQAKRPDRLMNALERSLKPALGQAYEDVERDTPGPELTPEIQEDLAGAMAAHNRGPQTEAAREYVKARRAHQRALRPLAEQRLLEVLRDALVPELLGR